MIVFDPVYFIFVGPAFLLAMFAQMRVKSAFAQWSQVGSSARLPGREVARRVMQHAGVGGVQIEPSQGFLSDHYDPSRRILRLSPDNYEGTSIAAAAIAAHEAGHAIQHAQAYAPLKLRSAAVPAATVGSSLSVICFFAGMFLQMQPLLWVGVIAFSAVVLFQLITLPVEFDASRRAKAVLVDSGIVHLEEEEKAVAKVLNAAALTYVAAAIQSILTLLYFLYRSGLIGGRR
ncbi:MAG: zinc metallopeptidase [Planctomycetota bacterium]